MRQIVAIHATFGIFHMVTGAVLCVALALVIVGGIKRIAHVAEILVPGMAVIYLIGAVGVILAYAENTLPSAASIFTQAFSGWSAVGGFLGASFAYAFNRGVNRGLYSNEAGQGSAPIAHASAKADDPVSEGAVSIMEPFIDTIVVCTITGLQMERVADFSGIRKAKYIDLTHPFEPQQAVWPGFSRASFAAAKAATDIEGYIKKDEIYTYEKHGFVATHYTLPTDQYGTQLDPPAHWNPPGATISDIPATYTIRPLAVINIVGKVKANEGYHLSVSDIKAWEAEHGRIPEGSVVMVRSDWSKRWSDIERFNKKPFPGVGLDALKFLHLERNIMLHGHEPLDTDTTANLEGEHWLMHNNYAQAEGVAHPDQVPEKGALIAIGFAKPLGGTGGYARYIAIASSDWPYGQTIKDFPGAPLMTQKLPLSRDSLGVMRPSQIQKKST